jgi:hypothetical protein
MAAKEVFYAWEGNTKFGNQSDGVAVLKLSPL